MASNTHNLKVGDRVQITHHRHAGHIGTIVQIPGTYGDTRVRVDGHERFYMTATDGISLDWYQIEPLRPRTITTETAW